MSWVVLTSLIFVGLANLREKVGVLSFPIHLTGMQVIYMHRVRLVTIQPFTSNADRERQRF